MEPRHLLGTLLLAGGVASGAHAQEELTLAPEPWLVELGFHGGLYFPPGNHEFYDTQAPSHFIALDSVAPVVGARWGVFPAEVFGLEAEFAYLPVMAGDKRAHLFRLGAHLIGQYPGRITPFILAGFAGYLTQSAVDQLGQDADPALHLGLGAKAYLNRWVALRLDGRYSLTNGHEEAGETGAVSHNLEVLLGLSLTLNRKGLPPPDLDPDKDGFAGAADKCPTAAGVAPDGCPAKDTDGDGVKDPDDKCPTVPSFEADGCPPPDSDKDGKLDRDDTCPNEAGTLANGCPDLDADRDGFPVASDACPTEPGPVGGCPDKDADGLADKDDRCPGEPESKNGFQDTDGCPDELPKAVQKFVGTIAGITFQSGSAKIATSSFSTLDAAVKVLREYPELRLEISGHTDDKGPREVNIKLSQDRADAVKAFFMLKDIAPDRVVTKGYGPDKPVADNKTNKGRAANRRIEFALITP